MKITVTNNIDICSTRNPKALFLNHVTFSIMLFLCVCVVLFFFALYLYCHVLNKGVIDD